MKKELISNVLTNGKCMFLAYDQGLEHGPTDFNDVNVNPKHIINLAHLGGFNGLVIHKGIAEQYKSELKQLKVPLILKLNGKTNLVNGDPLSTQLCTVTEAMKLGACAVGYTIYIGSAHEATMFSQFEKIQREAHAHNLPVIAWVYPRGSGIKGKSKRKLLAYAARVGLEIGADMVKLHWEGTVSDLIWAVKAAGKCKLVIAGGAKTDEKTFISHIQKAMEVGVTGIAIGRNVWQSKNPLELTKKIKEIIWK